MRVAATNKALGSAGCQPAVLGSLPSTRFARVIVPELFLCPLSKRAAGKLPAAAGWQPAIPSQQ